MRYLTPIPKQFVDQSGIPYSDGIISVYLSGSDELADIFEDAEGGALYPNPCKLDSNGAWQCFVPGDIPLDYIVQDRNGNVVFSYYNILPASDSGAVFTVKGTEGEINVANRVTASGRREATVGLDPEFKQRVTDAENDIGDLNERVNGVEGSVDDLARDIGEVDVKVEDVAADVEGLHTSLNNKKDRQTPYSLNDIPPDRTVKSITQDANGRMQVETQNIELPDYSQRFNNIENEQAVDEKVIAAALNDLNARVEAVEDSQDEKNIGDRTADSLDAQVLMVGGIPVKFRQAAKSLDGATNKTVTNISQDENGVITVTYSAIAFPDWTGAITAATDLCEKLANKKTTVTGNEGSNTYYPTIKALVDYLDSRLQNLGGKKITNNGVPFTTDSQLPTTTPYYGQNINSDDYAYVQDTGLASRYMAIVTGSSVVWSLDYEIAIPVFTAEQQAAIDSGVTSEMLDTFLTKTGDGSNVTASFTAADSRTNISTGEKLSVIFGKIAKWFSDLKALAFKDKVSDSDISGTIADAHIASASSWNAKQNALPTTGTPSSTFAINVSGNAATATHLNAYGEWVTWDVGEYDSTKPFAKIAEKEWLLSGSNGAGQQLQIEYNNNYFVRVRLNFRTQGIQGFTIHEVKVLESNITRAELEDRIRITYFTYNSGANACIHVYVKFTGEWQNWRVRQLDAQSGDNGHENWVPFDFHNGRGAGVATPQGTQAEYVYPVDSELDNTSEKPVQNKVIANALARIHSAQTESWSGEASVTATGVSNSGMIRFYASLDLNHGWGDGTHGFINYEVNCTSSSRKGESVCEVSVIPGYSGGAQGIRFLGYPFKFVENPPQYVNGTGVHVCGVGDCWIGSLRTIPSRLIVEVDTDSSKFSVGDTLGISVRVTATKLL